MAEIREVLVPDIGDFADVPVIEVLVSPGDTVAPEDPLVTLESDKATMDVPAPFGGTVAEIRVSVGDTVSEGSPILALQVQSNGAQPGVGDPGPGRDEARRPTRPCPPRHRLSRPGTRTARRPTRARRCGASPASWPWT